MEQLLNFTAPFDPRLLDNVISTLYGGSQQERAAAQQVLTQFQQHPEAWLRVDAILERCQNINSKYFGLQILESVIKYRWKALPREQCETLKNYIVNLVITLSQNEQNLHSQRMFINKLNLILVAIIKQEWPQQWRNLIPEIVGSSKTSESLCENNMNIFKLLSEEVFDFSSGEMTQSKIKELKESFNQEFSLIFQLCDWILANSQKASLVTATLQTLLRFLNWIPLGYIFETNMINLLVNRFFPIPQFRNDALKCLIEIAGLDVSTYDQQYETLFSSFMQYLPSMIPDPTKIPTVFEDSSDEDKEFVQHLGLFFTSFFRLHGKFAEQKKHHSLTLQAHEYLVEISRVDETEIFKTCLEYWNYLAQNLYQSDRTTPQQHALFLSQPFISKVQLLSPRRALYAPILSKVRRVMINKMAKPEEVIIVEDENGEVIKEYMKDVDAIQLYKNMRETLIFLTHLDYEDTENIMLETLSAQVNAREWSRHTLNTLCWAIGSISGSMTEIEEKKFLVNVIKDLLGMVEMNRGKENKAIIASNIMYVVGQYPRFLRAHWKFLKTVVNKLFEFMHEKFPGVQEMAVDTFLKISIKCKKKFVVLQATEKSPFIDELLDGLSGIISDLEPQHIHIFYEAVGHMISMADQQRRDSLINRLMSLPNARWNEIIGLAAQSVENLKNPVILKDLTNLLKTNSSVASSLHNSYMNQLRVIYREMLELYKAYSTIITQEVVEKGPNATKFSHVRSMRSVKKETLKVIEIFIEHTEQPQVVATHFVPPLLEAILGDYQSSVPDARDPGVLSLTAVAINKLKDHITPEIPRILEAVIECTLPMITANFEDYPEHRRNFFSLLGATNKNCFKAFFLIPPQGFKLVIDSVLWALKHTERIISQAGLDILYELLQNVEKTDAANAFYQSFYLVLLQDILYVLTDTLHKPGLKTQALILQHLCFIVETGKVTAPLFPPNQFPGLTNQVFVKQHIAKLLSESFKNLSPAQVQQFVLGLFDQTKDPSAYKEHLRDFLVQMKEFSRDTAELYEEERLAQQNAQQEILRAVPGIIRPSDLPDDSVSDMAE